MRNGDGHGATDLLLIARVLFFSSMLSQQSFHLTRTFVGVLQPEPFEDPLFKDPSFLQSILSCGPVSVDQSALAQFAAPEIACDDDQNVLQSIGSNGVHDGLTCTAFRFPIIVHVLLLRFDTDPESITVVGGIGIILLNGTEFAFHFLPIPDRHGEGEELASFFPMIPLNSSFEGIVAVAHWAGTIQEQKRS